MTAASRKILSGNYSDSDNHVVADLRVPIHSVSVIVGARGVNVQQLEKRCNVRISCFPKERSGRITVTGSIDNVVSSLPSLHSYCTSEHFMLEASECGPGAEGASPPAPWTMLVPPDVAPFIKGSRGATVHEIQRISGAQVTIQDRGDPIVHPTYKTVLIQGSHQQLRLAARMIVAGLSQGSEMPTRVLFLAPSNLGKLIVGAGGTNVLRFQSIHYVRMEVPKTDLEMAPHLKAIEIVGHVEGIIGVASDIYNLVEVNQKRY